MEVCQQGWRWAGKSHVAPRTSRHGPAGVSGCVAQAGGDDHLEAGEQGWVAGLEGCACSWLHTGSPFPPPSYLCHHPFFSESSSILQLADEVPWACLAFAKSRWEGADHAAGGGPAGPGLRLSGQARALREPEDA